MTNFFNQFKSAGTGKDTLLGIIMSFVICIGCLFQTNSIKSDVNIVLFEKSSIITLELITLLSGISFLVYTASCLFKSRRKYIIRSCGFLVEALYLILLSHTILQAYPPLNVTAFVFLLLAVLHVFNAMYALNIEGKTNDSNPRSNSID